MPRRIPVRASMTKTLRARASAIAPENEEEYYDEQEPSMRFSHALIVVLILHLIAVGGIFGFNMLKAKQIANARMEEKAALPQPSAPPADLSAPDDVTNTGGGSLPTGPQPTPPPPVRPLVAAPDQSPAAASSPSSAKAKTHKIVVGDTLTKIAAKYGTTVHALEKANNLTSAASIRVGQILKIPAAGQELATPKVITTPDPTPRPTPAATAVAVAPKAAAPEPVAEASKSPEPITAAANGSTTYVVKKGDNPYSLAHRFHVSYSELLKINNITDPKKLQIGQKLIIPPPKTTKTPKKD